jgi:hypothetical protein
VAKRSTIIPDDRNGPGYDVTNTPYGKGVEAMAQQDVLDAQQAAKDKRLNELQTSYYSEASKMMNEMNVKWLSEMAGGYAEQIATINEGYKQQAEELKRIASANTKRQQRELEMRRTAAGKSAPDQGKRRNTIMTEDEFNANKGKTLLGI